LGWGLAVVVLSAGLAGAAAAQTPAERYAAPADEIPVLRGRVEKQGAYLQARIAEISAVGPSAPSWKRRRPGWTARLRARYRARRHSHPRFVEPIS
jgi:hypothetical protein